MLFECKLEVDAELSSHLVKFQDGDAHGQAHGHKMISVKIVGGKRSW